ncbi:MAG: class I SAM-dependent methyltransferase [Candidatus Hydrogenedentes bacterium]|nr:class I SAM-dependent methyltransferase [Candidatus Hydrogenedentota bacterium]
MTNGDPFGEIARYYDKIMDFVNYDRWFMIATSLAELLPTDFIHLDAACGTGTLLRKVRRIGWKSVGIDLSSGMIRAGRSRGAVAPAAVADLRALPFHSSVDYVTCLFDSLNFILEDGGLDLAFRSLAGALKPGGLIYFDIVTERMITEHFDGQEWTENNGQFTTTWRSKYSRKSHLAETEIRVTKGAGGMFRERVYAPEEIEAAVQGAGLTILDTLDAHTWETPSRKSIRLDFVAAQHPAQGIIKQFKAIRNSIRAKL